MTSTRIGWIGAGRMGVPMAGFLISAGYPLTIYSRTAPSRQKVVALGAREAGDVAACVREAGVIFSSITDDDALRAIALGENGVFANAARGSIFVETSTVSTEVSAEVADAAQRAGIDYLRMPISGNSASARKGEVTVMVSGPESAWKKIQPLATTFSTKQIYLGDGEQARVMKLVVNSLVVNQAQAIAEALVLGSKGGLDRDTMLDTLAQSTVSSPWLKIKIDALRKNDYTATMSTRLILKDIDLMLAAARSYELAMPITATTRQLMQVLVGEGFGEDDYMATVKLAARQSGVEREWP